MMPNRIPTWRPPRFTGGVTQKETAHYHSPEWKARRRRILLRDAFRCQAERDGRKCLRVVDGKEAHIDHVIPLEDGGTDSDDNLLTRCSSCHGRKTRAEQRSRGLI